MVQHRFQQLWSYMLWHLDETVASKTNISGYWNVLFVITLLSATWQEQTNPVQNLRARAPENNIILSQCGCRGPLEQGEFTCDLVWKALIRSYHFILYFLHIPLFEGVELESAGLWLGDRTLHASIQGRSLQNTLEDYRQHLAKLQQNLGMIKWVHVFFCHPQRNWNVCHRSKLHT